MYYLSFCLLLVLLFKWYSVEGLYPSTMTATNGTPNLDALIDTGVTSKFLIDKTFAISTDEIDQQFNSVPLSLNQLIS